MKIKRVMISQPMGGLDDGKIKETRRRATENLRKEGFEVADSYFSEEWLNVNARGVKNKSLWCLAKSIEVMSHCDAVYFCEGWEKARGCMIEREAAAAYGLEIFEEISLKENIEKEMEEAGVKTLKIENPFLKEDDNED